MQMAVIEFARNVLGLKEAHSTEMDPDTPEPVIDLMEEQKKITAKVAPCDWVLIPVISNLVPWPIIFMGKIP